MLKHEPGTDPDRTRAMRAGYYLDPVIVGWVIPGPKMSSPRLKLHLIYPVPMPESSTELGKKY